MDKVAASVRAVSLPRDLEVIASIDTGFVVNEMLAVDSGAAGFALRRISMPTSLSKSLSPIDLSEEWDVAYLASAGAGAAGFAAARHEKWNNRLVLSHLYVDRLHRRRGVGTLLLSTIVEVGRRLGCDHLWAETSNLNAQAVDAYRSWGFELCGLDTSLYRGTVARGEIALFLSLRL